MQASIFKLWIFSICVRGESSVTLESCGSLVKIPGYFEGASLHCVQKEPCQSLCSDLDTFVQCLKSDGKNWGQIRCLSCSPGNLSKIFNSCIFWRAQFSWNVSSGQGGTLSDIELLSGNLIHSPPIFLVLNYMPMKCDFCTDWSC